MTEQPSASEKRSIPELMEILKRLIREGEELRQRVWQNEREKREVETALMDARRGT